MVSDWEYEAKLAAYTAAPVAILALLAIPSYTPNPKP
jgi:hypothetical protein